MYYQQKLQTLTMRTNEKMSFPVFTSLQRIIKFSAKREAQKKDKLFCSYSPVFFLFSTI